MSRASVLAAALALTACTPTRPRAPTDTPPPAPPAPPPTFEDRFAAAVTDLRRLPAKADADACAALALRFLALSNEHASTQGTPHAGALFDAGLARLTCDPDDEGAVQHFEAAFAADASLARWKTPPAGVLLGLAITTEEKRVAERPEDAEAALRLATLLARRRRVTTEGPCTSDLDCARRLLDRAETKLGKTPVLLRERTLVLAGLARETAERRAKRDPALESGALRWNAPRGPASSLVLDAAWDACVGALALDPKDASIHEACGVAAYEAGDLPEAARRFDEAVRLDPRRLSAHYDAGALARGTGNFVSAEAHFRAAFEIDPADYETRVALSGVLAGKGDTAGAEEQADRAIALRPKRPEAWVARALALEASLRIRFTGDEKERLPILRRAMESLREATRRTKDPTVVARLNDLVAAWDDQWGIHPWLVEGIKAAPEAPPPLDTPAFP